MSRRALVWRALRGIWPLWAVGFIDELASGVGPLSTPELAEALGITPGLALAFTLGVGGLLVGLTPWLLRRGRRHLAFALFGVGLCQVALGLSSSIAIVTLAVLAWGPLATIANGVAEARLVRALGPERAMSKWAIAGSLGDLLGPLVVLVVGLVSTTPRHAFLVVAIVPIVVAPFLWRTETERADAGDDEDAPLELRAHAKDRVLVLALIGAAACTLLDEILLGFTALYMSGHFAMGAPARALTIACATGAGLVSLVVLDRVQPNPVRALLWSGVACGVAFACALLAPGPWTFGVALACATAAAVWHHPLTTALAYARAKDPLVVTALGAFLEPFELLAPFALALVADRAGAHVALCLLLAQPLLIVIVALGIRRAGAQGPQGHP